MKPFVALTVAALALPAWVAAQNAIGPTSKDSNPIVTFTAQFDSAGNKIASGAVTQYPPCPVSMQAKQGSGGGLVMVKKAQPDAQSGKQEAFRPAGNIHLILSKVPISELDLAQVAGATVTARGLSGRSHSIPLVIGADSSDIRRTLNVTFSHENDGSLYADLDLPGFTSVRSIRIDSIRLKDGSRWTFDTRQGCVVTPDPLMLIANQ